MYGTPWHVTDHAGEGELPDYLWLSRFEHYYRLSADQLPHVLYRDVLDISALRFRRWQHAGTVTGARLWLFCLPSGQIVAVLSIDTSSDLIETIDLLEDCYFGDVQIGQMSAEEYAHALATQLGATLPRPDPPLAVAASPHRSCSSIPRSTRAGGRIGDGAIFPGPSPSVITRFCLQAGCCIGRCLRIGSAEVLHTLATVSRTERATGMRQRMTRISEAVAAYALAAALLITGAAVLAGAVIRKVAAEPT